MEPPSLTLGIEEEYQVVDPETGELASFAWEAVDDERIVPGQVKPELLTSMVEIGTGVCDTPRRAGRELRQLRRKLAGMAGDRGLALAAAGTHPSSSWEEQEITPQERYLGLATDYQDVARRLLIFGMHVHVGVSGDELRVEAMNAARYFMPHILALTTSSPFWRGRETGLQSYRTAVWSQFPRSGVPPVFSTWDDYANLRDELVQTGCIEDASKIYWDVRPHHEFGTLEFRFPDVCTRVEDAICVAALLQAVVARLWRLRRDNLSFRIYPAELIQENMWRAARYGIEGQLVDFGKGEEVPVPELIRELVEEFLADVVDALGTREEVTHAYEILDRGTSAERQLAVYAETGSLAAVVDDLVRTTLAGVDPQTTA